MRLPTFYEQNLIPNWGSVFCHIKHQEKSIFKRISWENGYGQQNQCDPETTITEEEYEREISKQS